MSNQSRIVIDTESMNAYKDGVLKNRLVAGDYSSFQLDIGSNIITFAGSVTRVLVSNYSRWI